MKKSQQKRSSFFRGMKRDEGIDDLTFDTWKQGLQKELPLFWQSVTGFK